MISVVYITNRFEPQTDWFLGSLLPQFRAGESPQIIIVAPPYSNVQLFPGVLRVPPKPTIWSGPHRITKEDWWSASNARNTGICLATQPWIAFVDDRSVLRPGWLDRVRQAMAEEYVVCGTYQKVQNLSIVNGTMTYTAMPGRDSRLEYVEKYWRTPTDPYGPFDCPGEWTYGCSLALPLEWALRVGGFDETCDGSSGEDYIFGLMLQNHQFHIRFDPRMRMIEDRTPERCGPIAKRKDKGISPNDKSHALLERLRVLKHALQPPNLREIRNAVLNGQSFPGPSANQLDWYDGQPIKNME